MFWFTADTHFGHRNIIQHCGRPFQSVEEMDAQILRNINDLVKEQDTLIHLGDFSWFGDYSPIDYRRRINCRNVHLMMGNHDEEKKIVKAGFNVIYKEDTLQYFNFKKEDIKLVCFHYPLASWKRFHLHLHGHTHGTLEKKPMRWDVGVDANRFKPISLRELGIMYEESDKEWM